MNCKDTNKKKIGLSEPEWLSRIEPVSAVSSNNVTIAAAPKRQIYTAPEQTRLKNNSKSI